MVFWSLPGARPSPRSMRPGWRVSRVPYCSAMVSGAWLGSMTPPAPSRMRLVCAATWAMSTLVADEAMVGMLWCSAYQIRRYPHSSACWARVTLASRLSPAVSPVPMCARSRMESGTDMAVRALSSWGQNRCREGASRHVWSTTAAPGGLFPPSAARSRCRRGLPAGAAPGSAQSEDRSFPLPGEGVGDVLEDDERTGDGQQAHLGDPAGRDHAVEFQGERFGRVVPRRHPDVVTASGGGVLAEVH